MIYYKIRNKNNRELFLHGTPAYCSYNQTGRVFQDLGSLRRFITNYITSYSHRRSVKVSDWEVVEIEMVVKNTREIHEVVKPEKILAWLKDE